MTPLNAAMEAARAEYANDLRDMTDAEIALELSRELDNLAEIESWVEALTAEQAHRAKGAAS